MLSSREAIWALVAHRKTHPLDRPILVRHKTMATATKKIPPAPQTPSGREETWESETFGGPDRPGIRRDLSLSGFT